MRHGSAAILILAVLGCDSGPNEPGRAQPPTLDEQPLLTGAEDDLPSELIAGLGTVAFVRTGSTGEFRVGIASTTDGGTIGAPQPLVRLLDVQSTDDPPALGYTAGQYFLLYARPREGESGADVYLQRLTLDGDLSGDEVMLSSGTGTAVPRAVIVWEHGAVLLYSEDDAGVPVLWARHFAVNPEGLTDPMMVSSPGTHATGYWNGFSFNMLYQRGAESDPVDLRGRPLAPPITPQSGWAVGTESQVAASPGVLRSAPAWSYSGSYPTLVAWSEEVAPGTVAVRGIAASTASFAASGSPFDISGRDGNYTLTSAARHELRYVVVWRTEERATNARLMIRPLEMDGLAPVADAAPLLETRDDPGELAVDGMLRASGDGQLLTALVMRRSPANGWDAFLAPVPLSVTNH